MWWYASAFFSAATRISVICWSSLFRVLMHSSCGVLSENILCTLSYFLSILCAFHVDWMCFLYFFTRFGIPVLSRRKSWYIIFISSLSNSISSSMSKKRPRWSDSYPKPKGAIPARLMLSRMYFVVHMWSIASLPREKVRGNFLFAFYFQKHYIIQFDRVSR